MANNLRRQINHLAVDLSEVLDKYETIYVFESTIKEDFRILFSEEIDDINMTLGEFMLNKFGDDWSLIQDRERPGYIRRKVYMQDAQPMITDGNSQNGVKRQNGATQPAPPEVKKTTAPPLKSGPIVEEPSSTPSPSGIASTPTLPERPLITEVIHTQNDNDDLYDTALSSADECVRAGYGDLVDVEVLARNYKNYLQTRNDPDDLSQLMTTAFEKFEKKEDNKSRSPQPTKWTPVAEGLPKEIPKTEEPKVEPPQPKEVPPPNGNSAPHDPVSPAPSSKQTSSAFHDMQAEQRMKPNYERLFYRVQHDAVRASAKVNDYRNKDYYQDFLKHTRLYEPLPPGSDLEKFISRKPDNQGTIIYILQFLNYCYPRGCTAQELYNFERQFQRRDATIPLGVHTRLCSMYDCVREGLIKVKEVKNNEPLFLVHDHLKNVHLWRLPAGLPSNVYRVLFTQGNKLLPELAERGDMHLDDHHDFLKENVALADLIRLANNFPLLFRLKADDQQVFNQNETYMSLAPNLPHWKIVLDCADYTDELLECDCMDCCGFFPVDLYESTSSETNYYYAPICYTREELIGIGYRMPQVQLFDLSIPREFLRCGLRI